MKGEHRFSHVEAVGRVDKAMRVILKDMKPLITREGKGVVHADIRRGRFTVTVFDKSYNGKYEIVAAMSKNPEVVRLFPIMLERIINQAFDRPQIEVGRLPDAKVRLIRKRVRAGEKQYEVAADMGLNPNTVSLIVNYKLYSDVEDEIDGDD